MKGIQLGCFFLAKEMNEMFDATLETLYMLFVSLMISWIFAFPLGTLVSETRPGGLFRNKIANFVLNRVIDVGRSIPFILLVVFLFLLLTPSQIDIWL